MSLRAVKDTLSRIPVAGRMMQQAYKCYRGWRYDPARHVGRLLGGRADLQVVQIDSHDGATDDPVQRQLAAHPGWRALLVEPVPFVFERLRARYQGSPRVRLANLAVADRDGSLPFYHLSADTKARFPALPHYWDQLGSFDRAHIVKHFGERVAECIMETAIQACSLSSLLERHGITAVDVLHIDTEGADWMILRQLPLDRIQPAVIIAEHKHLTAPDREQMLAFLAPHYRVEDFGQDFFCTRRLPPP